MKILNLNQLIKYFSPFGAFLASMDISERPLLIAVFADIRNLCIEADRQVWAVVAAASDGCRRPRLCENALIA